MHGLLWVPWVIAMRWPGLMLSMTDPTPQRQREAARMVTEKVAAAQAGGLAVAELMATLWWRSLTNWWSTAPQVQQRMLTAALAPSGRTVAANARRLSRRKRS